MFRLRLAREVQRTWVDITGDVIWRETDFTQVAKTGPGSFTITMKGAQNQFMAGEEIHFEVDGLRVFGGWVTDVERGYFFSDEAQPKTVLHGTDYNILFDRLVMRNWPWEFSTRDSTEDCSSITTRSGSSGAYRSWPPYPKGTLDKTMIQDAFSKYFLPDLPLAFDFTNSVDVIDTPAPVAPWVMPEAGSPLRVFMQSISQITTGVWWIDPYMVLHYHSRAQVTAPYPITDGIGGISSRGLVVTRDISAMINDVLVWGTLAKTIEGEIMVAHEYGDGKWKERYWLEIINTLQGYIQNLLNVPPAKRTTFQKNELVLYQARMVDYKARLEIIRANPDVASVDLYGFWQLGEFRQDIHHQKWLARRAWSILTRYDEPIIRATATIWDPGYQAGQVVTVTSSVYGINVDLVIRSLHITFTVGKEPVGNTYYALPQYDLEMGLDPEAPWNIYDYLPYPGENTAGLGADNTGG
jgi:hypothetical protein